MLEYNILTQYCRKTMVRKCVYIIHGQCLVGLWSVFVSFTDRMYVVFGIILPHRHNSIGKQGRDNEFISFVLIYSLTQLCWLVISDCLNLLVICMWFWNHYTTLTQ